MPSEFLTFLEFARWESDPGSPPEGSEGGSVLVGLARLWNTIQEGNPLLLSEPTGLPAAPAALLVVQAGPPWVWVVVCTGGEVVFGRASDIATAEETARLDLEDFDENQDEPISVYTHTPKLANYVEIHVLVRRVSLGRTTSYRLYRARLGLAEASLRPLPETREGPTGAWLPLDISEQQIPEYLRIVPLSVAPGLDPIDTGISCLEKNRIAKLEVERGLVHRATWTGSRVFVGTQNGHLVDRGTGTGMPLNDEPFDTAVLALAGQSLGDGSASRIAVADGTQCVAGYTVDAAGKGTPLWRRRLDDTASALALLARASQPGEREVDWPDVLAGVRSGALHRLRYIPMSRLEALWERELLAIAGGVPWKAAAWAAWARQSGGEEETQVALWGRCVVLLDRLRRMGGLDEREELEVATWVGGFHYRDLWSLIGRAVERDIRGCLDAPHAPRLSWRFLLALHRATGLELKDRMDQEIRILDRRLGDGPRPQDPAFDELVRLARTDPRAWWGWANQGSSFENLPGDLPQGLHFLANRAAEAFLLERYHVWEDLRPRGIAKIKEGENACLVVMGRDELRCIPEGSTQAITIGLPSEGAILRTLRRVDLGDGESVAVVGAQQGLAFVVYADRGRECLDIRAPSDRVGRGVAPLPMASDGRARFGMLWNDARSSYLEFFALDRGPKARGFAREGVVPLPLSRVTDLDVRQGEGVLWGALGTESTRKLLLVALPPTPQKPAPVLQEALLESPVKAVRFDPRRNTLYAGTRGGMLWAFDVPSLELKWVYRAGRSIRSLDLFELTPRGDEEPRTCCLVASDPEDIFLVDDLGRRVWHRRMTRTIRSARFLEGEGGGGVLGLACPEGYLALYRRSGLPEHREGFLSAVDGAPCALPSAVKELHTAYTCAASSVPAVYPTLKDRRARHALTKRLLEFENLQPEQLRELATCASFREIGALLSHLAPGVQGGWWAVLFQRLVEGKTERHGDNSERALRVAFAEALRHAPTTLGGRDFFETRIRQIPAPLRADPWVAVEATRRWWLACLEEPSSDPHPSELLLRNLHRLPPRLARSLRHVIRPPALGLLAERLAETAEKLEAATSEGDELPDRTQADVTALIEAFDALVLAVGKLGATGTALQTALLLARGEEPAPIPWDRLLDLARASRRVRHNPQSPLVSLASMVGRALPPGIPEEIWDLAAQRAWVAAAVTATASVLPEGERPSDGWQRLAMALSDALVGPVQRAFLANLRRIEGTVRVVPRELRVAWIFTGQLEVEIELRTEGFRELLDATVVTQIVGRTSGDTWGELPGLGHVAEGVHLRTTDPPRQLKLTGPCPPEVKEIRCRVSVASRTQDGYTCAWPLTSFKPEEPRPSPHVAFTWGQLPQRFFASQERVRQWKTGVLIVGAEPVCAPGMLAVALAQGAGSTLVDLDELLADAGPGRARPRLLTAEVVLALLDGAPSLETAARRAREQGPGALARNDVSRVVVHPCEETLRRLFAGEESCGWQLLGERLKSHGRDGASPVIVFLVSDEMAVHLGIRLGGSARSICLSRPPTPEEGIEDLPGLRAELFATLWRQGLGPEEAREIFERADEDLRVLGDWLANRRPDGRMTNLPPPSSLTRWARVDLRRLSPGDLLRVLLLYSICSELPLSELQPGMVLGSGFKKTRKKTTEPEPLGSGAVLTRSLLKVLSRPTRRSRNFPVAGFLPGRPTRVPAERGWLEHYIRLEESNALRLERLGFTRRLHGVHRLRPLYQQALDQLLSQASCDPRTVFLDLSPHGSLLDAIELASLAKLASEDENVLARGDPQQKHLFRAIGRLWTRESHSKPQNARDCIALSSFLAGDKTRPCVVRPSDPGKPILEALGPDHFTLIGLAPAATGGMLQYLAFSDEAPSPASWIGVRNALRAAVTAEESVEALLILLGRGIEDWPDPPPGEPLIVVREAALRSLLVAERPSATFWAMVRARVGLTRISPYRDSVALPPGSPLFVGRRRILDEILHRLPERSFLVVGPRQMGKTSLLNRVFHEARSRAELLFVRLDTQGMERREELRPGLVSEYRRLFGQEAPDLGSYELIKDLASHARERGARAVFLINEIDGLLEEDPRFLSLLRGMADASEAAFVLVGYATAVAACRDPWGPLYHFTSGYPGSKAFRLSVLEAEETGEIMRWLEEPPLGLSWATPRDRTQALSLLQECAYGIPWFLQQVCARLVERLERQAAWLLRADDLRAVLAAEEGESALLGHLHATNFSLLMKKPRERRDLRAVMTPEDRALNLAIRALLLAAVGRIYFAETRDTHFWSGLRDLDERTLAFTPEEARNWLNEEVDAHLNAREKRRVQRYLRAFPIEDLLSHLCLTLFLVPADEDLVLPRYAFLKHIYPIELRRAAASGRNLGDRLLETLVELHRVARELQPEETPW